MAEYDGAKQANKTILFGYTAMDTQQSTLLDPYFTEHFYTSSAYHQHVGFYKTP